MLCIEKEKEDSVSVSAKVSTLYIVCERRANGNVFGKSTMSKIELVGKFVLRRIAVDGMQFSERRATERFW